MKNKSIWEETKTFFPLFFDFLNSYKNNNLKICIIGASDGRFVIPLVKKFKVIAIEKNNFLVNGGEIKVKNKKINLLGLKKRLLVEGISRRAKIIEEDFLNLKQNLKVDAVFTSCTWDSSVNHAKPLKEYINKMQKMVKVSGIFCAEYMMPCEEKHKNIEHFLSEREINRFFKRNWLIMEEFYTPVFKDKPHFGKPVVHNHRMGFIIAKKLK